MWRIGNSKEPTMTRMLRMTINLNKKLNCYSSIQVETTTYKYNEPSHRFWLYTENTNGRYFNTWPEVIVAYRKLMRKEQF